MRLLSLFGKKAYSLEKISVLSTLRIKMAQKNVKELFLWHLKTVNLETAGPDASHYVMLYENQSTSKCVLKLLIRSISYFFEDQLQMQPS